MLQDMFIGSVTHGDGGVFKARLRTGFFTGPFRSSAVAADYPERFAQQALGHNSKAVHHAYSKQAEVTVPSLDDWEKEWLENLVGGALHLSSTISSSWRRWGQTRSTVTCSTALVGQPSSV